MIDIHVHILPGIDDGSPDMSTSLAMARVAAADGIKTLVATPHVMKGVFNNSKEIILEQVYRLQDCVQNENIPVEVLPGAEYYLEPDLPEKLSRGELLTINDSGKYLLVELPAALIPPYTNRVLYEIQIQGVTPIIAHPERNDGFARNPDQLAELVGRGILTQVTSLSLVGSFGSSAKKTALHMMRQGLVHTIASDAHSANGRAPYLSQASNLLQSLYEIDHVFNLTYHNPLCIISGQLGILGNTPPKPQTLWDKVRGSWQRKNSG